MFNGSEVVRISGIGEFVYIDDDSVKGRVLKQQMYKIGADESGATCNDNVFHIASALFKTGFAIADSVCG